MEYSLIKSDGMFSITAVSGKIVGRVVPGEHESLHADDVIEAVGNGVFCWRRTFRLKEGQPSQRVRLVMDFQTEDASRFSVVPGISWNGNLNDPGNVYHGFECNGVPWSFASHRTLVPGCTYSEAELYSVGLFGEATDANGGISCSMIPTQVNTIHQLIVPEEEMPLRIVRRDHGLSPGSARVLFMSPGETRQITAWLVVCPVNRPRTGYQHLLDVAWRHAYRPTLPKYSSAQLWDMALDYAMHSLWDATAKKFHTSMAYTPDKGWFATGGFSIGWCGRNAELANVLLTAHLAAANPTMLSMALDCLDAFAELVSDEPVESETNLQTNPFLRFHALAADANMLGDAATGYLNASRLVEQCNIKRPAYQNIALQICDAALAVQQADGSFTGPECKRGSIGAAFIPPLIHAYELTHDLKYLKAAQAAIQFYMGMFYHDGYLWGGALDTRSIDKETVAPLLEGAIKLYGITQDSAYLKQAEDAAYYFAAWQFAQSIPNVPGSLMDAIGYDTLGGTSVATVHMCADPYALRCIAWLIELADLTGHIIWEQRAAAAWNNATHGISDGSLILQGINTPRPRGSQDETVNHTDWGYDLPGLYTSIDNLNPRGAGQCWLTAWPASMRLTLLSDVKLRARIDAWVNGFQE
jgi:hypothetical protein